MQNIPKMNRENIAVGLDIGTTKIVAMVGKKNEYGKLEILGLGNAKSDGVQRGVVHNITKTIQSIQKAVEEAEQESGIKINEVVVGIAGQHIRSMQHSEYIIRQDPDSVISEEDIELLINQVKKLGMLPGEEIIHVLPQEFKIDDEIGVKEPIGMYGRRLEANFHVVVGQSASIRNAGRCVKDAGLELAGLTLEPLASANAVLSEEEKEAGVALVDIGGGTTDLAIFKDGIIRHTYVIPFGGNVITEDIKEGCSIIERNAEVLKVKFGSAWPGECRDQDVISIPGLRGHDPKEISMKNLSKIINARVTEIIEMVFEQIRQYGYDNPQKKLIAGIVLTGGGSELKHIKQLVEYITGIDTRIGYPNEHVAGESAERISRPLYATSVGLTMESEMMLRKNKIRGAEKNQLEEDLKPLEVIDEGQPTQETNKKTTKQNLGKTENVVMRSFNNFFTKFKNFIDSGEDY